MFKCISRWNFEFLLPAHEQLVESSWAENAVCALTWFFWPPVTLPETTALQMHAVDSEFRCEEEIQNNNNSIETTTFVA